MNDWAGNKERQMHLHRRIMRECRLTREHPIDVAGAVGTVVANSICDIAVSYEDAVKGLTEHFKDMKEVLKQRFDVKGDD